MVSRWTSGARLSEDQKRALIGLLSAPPLVFARGRDLLRADEVVEQAYMLRDGWAMWHELLPDGSRQIFDFRLPGDLLGLEAMVLAHGLIQHGHSREEAVVDHLSVTAITDVAVVPIRIPALMAVFDRHPELAILLLTSLSLGRSARFRRRLVNFGRRSARASTADLLLELWERQRAIGRADERGFFLPVTQAELGDALGIASAYLSRILAELDRDGVLTISRSGPRRVTVHDAGRLCRIAEDLDRAEREAHLRQIDRPAASSVRDPSA